MPYTAIFLPKAEKYLVKLDKETYEQIEEHVEELKKNPFKCRPLADIKKLGGFKSPSMYRMRIGR
jgi:mRNA-degrading endonuclease RelE of RelBE toxin-antitoxin system